MNLYIDTCKKNDLSINPSIIAEISSGKIGGPSINNNSGIMFN